MAQIRLLNRLLASAAGSGPDQVAHGSAVIENYFSARDAREVVADGSEMGRFAKTLAELHLSRAGTSGLCYAHCHIDRIELSSALWLRRLIIDAMKAVSGRRQAVLLVTGLRAAICPAGRYWTRKRAAEYAKVRGWIDELACEWVSRGCQLNVIVI